MIYVKEHRSKVVSTDEEDIYSVWWKYGGSHASLRMTNILLGGQTELLNILLWRKRATLRYEIHVMLDSKYGEISRQFITYQPPRWNNMRTLTYNLNTIITTTIEQLSTNHAY
jgi:hypothetical protein